MGLCDNHRSAAGAAARALGLLCAACTLVCATAKSQDPVPPPNIVLILTDDQDTMLGGDWMMPKLRQYVSNLGFNASNYVVNHASCCPSRASTLVGMCAHNTKVINDASGWPAFRDMGLEQMTGHLMLQQGGYRTALIGEFMGGYASSNYTYVPPGFDRWFSIGDDIDYIGWNVSDQGVPVMYGSNETDYSTDVIAREAEKFIQANAIDKRPFFAWVSPYAPHSPYLPAPRHQGTLRGLKLPTSPAFNESGPLLAKKKSVVPQLPVIPRAFGPAYNFVAQSRAESLLAVDDLVERVVQALTSTGQLSNTYIFYTSDSGTKLGHRRMLSGGQGPYEEDVRVPLHVRGPGVPLGQRLPHLLSNVDLVPTFLDLAGVDDPFEARRDGVSFAPVLRGNKEAVANPASLRTALLIEKLSAGGSDSQVSTLVPMPDNAANDIFAGAWRPQLLQNGSWPLEVVAFEEAYETRFLTVRRQNFMNSPFVPPRAGSPTGWTKFLGLGAAANVSVEALRRIEMGSWPGAYYALRTLRYKYIEWKDGFELFDLQVDPFELNNVFEGAPRALVVDLQRTLETLKMCRGLSCRFRNAATAFSSTPPPTKKP